MGKRADALPTPAPSQKRGSSTQRAYHQHRQTHQGRKTLGSNVLYQCISKTGERRREQVEGLALPIRALAGLAQVEKPSLRGGRRRFAVTFAILTAKIAESGNDNSSNPTISTLPLQY
jgi:hypothetical protein